MNKILTKIQSRLNRRGLKVSLGDIREKYLTLELLDYDNPTEQELSDVVDYFVRLLTLPAPVELKSISNQIETVETSDLEDNTDSGAITLQDKHELVNNTAQTLGIALNTQEIVNIAENINYSSDDLHNSLEDIKSAIIAFIQHKAVLNNQKINQVVNDITQIASDKFHENSQQLADGLQEINQQLQQQNTDFKSQVKSALTAFAIPTIKAG